MLDDYSVLLPEGFSFSFQVGQHDGRATQDITRPFDQPSPGRSIAAPTRRGQGKEGKGVRSVFWADQDILVRQLRELCVEPETSSQLFHGKKINLTPFFRHGTAELER